MKKSNFKLGLGLFIWMVLLLAGLALVGCAFLWSPIADSEWANIALIGGGVLALLSLILCLVLSSKLNKHADKVEPEDDIVPVGEQEEIEVNANKINYIPSQNVFDFVTMGNEQGIEDKFAQIALMDKTQFVIYIAKLFSLKGYQVRLTTVVDNRDIDMLVEKRGVVIAIGCIRSDKVLSVGDIVSIHDGLKYYNAHSAMALTNTYFDRSALDFAKAQGMSLVDRTILVEDFF